MQRECEPMRKCPHDGAIRLAIKSIAMGIATALITSLSAQASGGDAWTKNFLQPLGWNFLWADASAAHYVRPLAAAKSAGNPTIWGRTEISPATSGTIRSEADLMELDCAHNRLRAIRMMQYSANNLSGTLNTITRPTEWAHAPPKSLAETVLRLGCKP
jgi:hypothetical protein